MSWIIEDWTGTVCFHSKEFETFDDAEGFLSENLDDYENDRQEYEVVEKGEIIEKNLLQNPFGLMKNIRKNG
jgi:hypothetical protein